MLLLRSLLLLAVLAGAARAQTLPAADIERLLADLDSDDWRQRQDAADALLQLDASSLPRLKAAADATTDADVSNALLHAITHIQDTLIGAATLVNLEAAAAPALPALKKLAGQVKFPLVLDPQLLAGKTVDLRADQQPFWLPMKELALQTGLQVSPSPGDGNHLLLGERSGSVINRRSTVAGPFLITPLQATMSMQLDLLPAQPAMKSRNANLSLVIVPEPLLRPTNVLVQAREAVDEHGNSLLPKADPNNPNLNRGWVGPTFGTGQSLASTTANIRLTPLPSGTRTVARLSGVVRYRVPLRKRELLVDAEFDGQRRTLALMGREIEATLNERDGQYELRLSVPFGGGGLGMDYQSMQNLHRDLYLIDADGNALYRTSTTQQANVQQRFEYTIVFTRQAASVAREGKPVGLPVKLLWELPVEYKQLESPFELRDLPLSVR